MATPPSKLRKVLHPKYKIRNHPLCVFKPHPIIAIIALIISSAIRPLVLTCRSNILYNLLFPSAPSSPALIPIRIEPITPPNITQPPTLLNDLEILISSLNDID